MNEIVVTPDGTFDEWMQGQKAVMKPIKMAWVLQAAQMVMAGSIVILLIENSYGPTSFLTATALAAAISFAVYYVMCIQITRHHRVAAYLAWKAGPRSTLRFSSEGVSSTSPTEECRYAWEHFGRVVDTKDTYTIVFRSPLYLCVPKRQIPAEQRTAFTDLLREKVGVSA